MEKEKLIVPFGDEHDLEIPQDAVDCSNMNFFDDLEYDCWDLIERYASALGLKLIPMDEGSDNSFNLSKSLQDFILDMFQGAGVKINFGSPEK